MAKRSSKDVGFVLVGGYNVIGALTSLTVKSTAVILDKTVLGDTDTQRAFVGMKDLAITQRGFFDDATGGFHDALVGSLGSNVVMCIGMNTNTAGAQFDGFEGPAVIDYERSAEVGQFHKAAASYSGSGAQDNGRIIHYLQARTTAGNTQSTSIDNLALTSNGGVAYLQVPALTLGGYTNLLVKLQHSTNNSTWVDLVTFTGATATQSTHSQRVVVAASTTVNRYLSVLWSWTGAGSDQTATFFVGFARS